MTGSPAVVLPVYQGQILEKQRRRELIHNRKVSKGDIEVCLAGGKQLKSYTVYSKVIVVRPTQ